GIEARLRSGRHRLETGMVFCRLADRDLRLCHVALRYQAKAVALSGKLGYLAQIGLGFPVEPERLASKPEIGIGLFQPCDEGKPDPLDLLPARSSLGLGHGLLQAALAEPRQLLIDRVKDRADAAR